MRYLLFFLVVFIIYPINMCRAQMVCDPSWTAEYKCLEHCGPCPDSGSSSAPSAPSMTADQQLGMQMGQLGMQMIIQGLQGPSPAEIAARQERERQIAAERAYAAQQQREAEEREKQKIYNNLSSEMKTEDGKPYGIPGLPGIYVNGPREGDSGLQLMKDDDTPAPANTNSNAVNPAPGNSENTNSQPAPQEAAVLQDNGGLQLMKDDDNTASAPAEAPSEQKAVNLSGVPSSEALQQLNAAGGPDFDGTKGGNAPLGKASPSASPSDSNVVDLRNAGTNTVNPAVVKGTAPSLATINPSDEDKALMRHQWEMSIDARYLSDPAVQQNIRDLWAAARKGDSKSDDKLKTVVADQFKADGMTPQQIQDFFTKFNAIFSGKWKTPKDWNEVSEVADNMDADAGVAATLSDAQNEVMSHKYYYSEKLAAIDPIESVKASHISYMGEDKQTKDDCVLYAIADGSGVKLEQVKSEFAATVKNLGMESIDDRVNPENIVTAPQQGGRGGLGPVEELLVAEKYGKVIPVANDSYARAIASTGRPVITTVNFNPPNGAQHKVVVTGVYRNRDGKLYYSVMDSNLGKDYKDSTDYVEKSFFETHLASGGFVVMPNDKQ